MKDSISVKWLDKMAFETDVNGHKLTLDATSAVGGNDRGPRPKPLMLVALAGCTGMDVVSILKKMRVSLSDFSVHVDGDLSEEHPKQFTSMHIVYEFWGKDLPLAKIEKAVKLSEESYCGVSALYKKAIKVTHEIKVNNLD